MRVLFIVRSTLYAVKGGDTVQVKETALQLKKMGVDVDIKLANEKIEYKSYTLLHFFNIIRPADILIHIKRSKKPFVITPILVNYSLYDKQQRGGLTGKLFKWLPAAGIEYVKTVYRALLRKDHLASVSYLWKGQRRSIKEILQQTKYILVNAEEEYRDLVKLYKFNAPFIIVPNGVDPNLFQAPKIEHRENELVLCVARIEGIKNQYNLIRALNNTPFKLVLIGDAAPNQKSYFKKCKKIAAGNISFINYLPQEQLLNYYATAKVHVLPSWFEVCGLASLEAAVMGCNIVITNNGYARSYFGDDAFYCDPELPESIFTAVEKAANNAQPIQLQNKIISQFSWKQAAEKIVVAYQKVTA